jgi:HAE1 family hydrophobic/amphiphilic exporter-1
MESQIAQPIEEALNTIEGIKELRRSAAPAPRSSLVTFELSRDIEAAAQDVRDRVGDRGAGSSARRRPADDQQVRHGSVAGALLAVVRPPFARELTEIADKLVKVQLERSPASAKWKSTAASNAPSTCGSMRTGSPPTRSPSPPCAMPWIVRTPTSPAAMSPPLARADLRTMGRLTSAKAFNDMVIATRNGSPIRVRDIGWAEDGTKEQRSIARLNGESES